jgi:L,D-transpeptidase YcbB
MSQTKRYINHTILFTFVASFSLLNFINAWADDSDSIKIAHIHLYHKTEVNKIYEDNGYKLIWTSRKNINNMLIALRYADWEGLNPNDYHFPDLQKYFHLRNKSADQRVIFDLLLSDAFIQYTYHLAKGKVNPKLIYETGWDTHYKYYNFADSLLMALNNQTLFKTINSFKPKHSAYMVLKNEIKYFLKINSRLESVVLVSSSIKPNERNTQIPIIRKILKERFKVNFNKSQSDSLLYDAHLQAAIRLVQAKYGLTPDAIIGFETLKILNLSIDDHIKVLQVNMERYRWLPHEMENRHTWINIADYTMQVYDNDELIFDMAVIVGRSRRKTPVLHSKIQYVTINPTWTIPPTILREDVLPAVKNSVAYLRKNNLKVIDRSGNVIKPDSLPWASYNEHNFPYILRQDPGLYNALGLFRFNFPNNYTVFLHDTNYRQLFIEHFRALSSGCIRIEQPFAFAIYLTNDKERIEKAIASKETVSISLKQAMPIYMTYFTAFSNRDDEINYRPDIYAYDEVLWQALTK